MMNRNGGYIGKWLMLCGIAALLLMGLSTTGYATDTVLAQFSRANQYFQQKKYDSALQLYEVCMSRGIFSPDLYYNAGCAAFESRQPGKAVYYFKKALLLAQEKGLPTTDIEHNLHLAEQQVKEMPETLPPLIFVVLWYRFVHLFSLNTWLLLLVINVWLGVLLWMMQRRAKRTRLAMKYVFGASICSLLLLVWITVSAYLSTHPQNSAICIAPQSALYTAPDSQSQVIMQLYGGVPCKILDTTGNWCKIQLPNHSSGWIRADAVKLL